MQRQRHVNNNTTNPKPTSNSLLNHHLNKNYLQKGSFTTVIPNPITGGVNIIRDSFNINYPSNDVNSGYENLVNNFNQDYGKLFKNYI